MELHKKSCHEEQATSESKTFLSKFSDYHTYYSQSRMLNELKGAAVPSCRCNLINVSKSPIHIKTSSSFYMVPITSKIIINIYYQDEHKKF